PIAGIETISAITAIRSSRLTHLRFEISDLRFEVSSSGFEISDLKFEILDFSGVSSNAASESKIASKPGNSLNFPPSGKLSPMPCQSLFRPSAASQWLGQAENALTSPMLRLKL